jgi:ribosome maturation factor RimP
LFGNIVLNHRGSEDGMGKHIRIGGSPAMSHSTAPSDKASQALFALVEPAVHSCGADLEAVEVSPAGRRHLVRVIVDKDGGVDLDAVAAISHAVSVVLEDADSNVGHLPIAAEVLRGSFTLEVTSPGVDRPLTLPRHWRRNVGRLVSVTCADGSTFHGRITGASDATAEVSVLGEPRTVTYAEVTRALIEIEFTRAASPDDEGK